MPASVLRRARARGGGRGGQAAAGVLRGGRRRGIARLRRGAREPRPHGAAVPPPRHPPTRTPRARARRAGTAARLCAAPHLFSSLRWLRSEATSEADMEVAWWACQPFMDPGCCRLFAHCERCCGVCISRARAAAALDWPLKQ
jgi:hypothetical protein